MKARTLIYWLSVMSEELGTSDFEVAFVPYPKKIVSVSRVDRLRASTEITTLNIAEGEHLVVLS